MKTIKELESEITFIIEKETEDILKLESIIESKRQRITDSIRVLEALERGGFI